ncbi:MAG: DUF4760 domain-containing protein, partial [Alphaproteobacteria bacterium]
RNNFIELTKDTDGMAKWATEENEKSKEAHFIRTVLNEYELIAVGMQKGALDFDIYKRWHRSGVMRYWFHAEAFVKALRERTKNEALYQEFEVLYGWMKGNDGKRPPRSRFIGQWF